MNIIRILCKKNKISEIKIPKVFFGVFCFILVLYPFILNAYTLTANGSVIISATVTSGTGGGGGRSGTGGGLNMPTTINFSGMAYPLSRVYILMDGSIVATTTADRFANFSVSFTGLLTNTYTFSVYGEDGNNRKSSFFSFPIYITEGTTVNISNIFLSPTIDVDKLEVKKGDNLIIFGQSAPKKEIDISVSSLPESFYKVFSNAMGGYLYYLDTSFLEIGNYQTKSKAVLDQKESLYSTPVMFSVGDKNIVKENNVCSTIRGDLNCDGHVNLIDFSIMAYWYRKANPPARVDLNSDGKITLTDFSIMAFNWTG